MTGDTDPHDQNLLKSCTVSEATLSPFNPLEEEKESVHELE